MSQKISAKEVGDLRARTGAGLIDCKKALEEAKGDAEEAITILKKKGRASAAKKAGRDATEGVIASYVHFNGRLGALVELSCETDFVAKNEDFKALAKDLALHIAAVGPLYMTRDEVPQDVIEKEKDIVRAQSEGKPDDAVEKIVEGKIKKYYQEHCLLEQAYVKDSKQTVEQVLQDNIAKMRENIVIKRFERYQIGN